MPLHPRTRLPPALITAADDDSAALPKPPTPRISAAPSAARSARGRAFLALEAMLFSASALSLAYSLYEWCCYPVEADFPYRTQAPLLFGATVIQVCLWRRRTGRPTARRPHHRLVRRARMIALIALVALMTGSVVLWLRAVAITASIFPDSTAVRLPVISGPFHDATVAMEDGRFYFHRGIDVEAIHRALRANLQAGSIVQGGSTITQQLAKNLFLSNDRTPWRKVQEMFLALALERRLTKEEILTLYRNTIDYGMGQHGIKHAASFYFHTSPDQLTLAQSAVLVGLVPAPPQTWLTEDQLEQGRQTALDRIAFWFPGRYSDSQRGAARSLPLESFVLPYLGPGRRGATEEISAHFEQVDFFFYATPDTPGPIARVSPELKAHLAAFLRDAREQCGLTGIDHLGVYNDRPVRGTQTVPSAHAFGQAIDICGFRFADGTHVSVADHGHPASLARIAPLEILLHRHFPVIISWREDLLRHDNHFHCEVRGNRHIIPGTSKTSMTRS